MMLNLFTFELVLHDASVSSLEEAEKAVRSRFFLDDVRVHIHSIEVEGIDVSPFSSSWRGRTRGPVRITGSATPART